MDCRTEIQSHSSFTGELAGRVIGDAPSRSVGLLGAWELNLNSGRFGVGDERGRIKVAFGAEQLP